MLRQLSNTKTSSLISDYAALLGDAALRTRTRNAEQAARLEAEIASRIKAEFVANMSHELRTPLNTIIGFSKLLAELEKRRLDDADIVQYARLIQDASSHLLGIINDILEITKIQSGTYTLDKRENDLNEIVEAAFADHRKRAEEHQVTINLATSAALDPLWCDGERIARACSCLLDNAIKFTPQGGSVTVETHARRSGGAAVVFRDTGIGMSAEEIKIALLPFGQVDGGRSRWREGTGLGLTIARGIVELHGGRLVIRSEKGQGTEVALLLPAGSHNPSRARRGEQGDRA